MPRPARVRPLEQIVNPHPERFGRSLAHSSSYLGLDCDSSRRGKSGFRWWSEFLRRHRWGVLVVWVLLFGAAGISSSSLGGALSGGGWYVQGSQSQQAAVQMARADLLGRGQTAVTLVVHDQRYTAPAPQFARRVREVTEALGRQSALHVGGAFGYGTLPAAQRDHYLGTDHRTAIDSVALGISDGTARRELPLAQSSLTTEFGHQGLLVSLISPAALWGAVNVLSQQDLLRAELITLPLILLILFLVYRSVMAAIVSVAVGVTAIVVTLGVLSPIAHHVQMSIFMENATTMLGLGVGVDYSLFVVSRHAEALRRGQSVTEAVAESLGTSGRTVALSGVTVIATMSALLLINLNVIISIAVGAITVVAFSVLSSTVLLPTLLHLLDRRILKGQLRWRRKDRDATPWAAAGGGSSRWHRLAVAVMRRPVLVIVLCATGLSALAVPAWQLRTFTPDARIIPASAASRQGYDYVQAQLGMGATSPVQVVITSSSSLVMGKNVSALTRLQTSLAALPGVSAAHSALSVAAATSPAHPTTILADRAALAPGLRDTIDHYLSRNDRITVIELLATHRASDLSTQHLVSAARKIAAQSSGSAFSVNVGGETAEGMDSNHVIQSKLPEVVLAMLALIYVLLLLTFRSVLLPLKAVVMNALSVAATYGILVLVFQKGEGAGVLGLTRTGNLQNFVPVLLLAILFSLSTDYEVFLLNRVRENYQHTGDNTGSVAAGLESTAPLISGAALLMVAVFGAFAFTGMVPIEQLGFGMAIAIIIDATVVRALLVPATMRLLGKWNWWLPL
jgi:putative drug exporter of the RND superfamily